MLMGLGTGNTAALFMRALGGRDALCITGVMTSEAPAPLAAPHGAHRRPRPNDQAIAISRVRSSLAPGSTARRALSESGECRSRMVCQWGGTYRRTLLRHCNG